MAPRLAQQRQDRIADLQRAVADDEADGRAGLRAAPCRANAIAAGSFGSSPRIDDLDRPLMHREAAALGQVERAADRSRAGEEVVVVAQADVHRRAAHEVGRAGGRCCGRAAPRRRRGRSCRPRSPRSRVAGRRAGGRPPTRCRHPSRSRRSTAKRTERSSAAGGVVNEPPPCGAPSTLATQE